MNCAGSVTLLQHLNLALSDEPDYQIEGVAGHEAAAYALTHDLDAWELVGETFNGLVMTPALADPIQIYLDYCRSLIEPGMPVYVEYGISSPVHPKFYGTTDFATYKPHLIHVVDLKMGEGVMVDVEDNPQAKYYAFGLIDGVERALNYTFDPLAVVRLAIVQPRGYLEPVRTYELTVKELKDWVHGVLVPAMLATEYDDSLTPGEWCRFCPAKLVCPLLTSVFQAAALANPKHIPDTSDVVLDLSGSLAAAAKHYIKALELEIFNRAMRGVMFEHHKLVPKKANRILKEGAVGLAKARWGDEIMTPPEVKSPAQLDLLPGGKEWTRQWAYTPDTGLTIAPISDSRMAVIVTPPEDRFSSVDTAEKSVTDW